MAEAVFMEKVRKAGLTGSIEADSAGTGEWHVGEAPHHGTRRVLQQKGIKYDGRARLVTKRDFAEFAYVIAMDRANLRDLGRLAQEELDFGEEGNSAGRDARATKPHVALLMSFAPELATDEVPDPYYTGKFDEVYELVDVATERLLETIRSEHGL
jgi:protein-tyrosine phosphatase